MPLKVVCRNPSNKAMNQPLYHIFVLMTMCCVVLRMGQYFFKNSYHWAKNVHKLILENGSVCCRHDICRNIYAKSVLKAELLCKKKTQVCAKYHVWPDQMMFCSMQNFKIIPRTTLPSFLLFLSQFYYVSFRMLWNQPRFGFDVYLMYILHCCSLIPQP